MANLKDLLEFQLRNAQDLIVILDQEKHAITARVSADIEAVAKQKITLVNQLNQTDQRIANHPHIENLTQDDTFKGLVEKINQLIEECQQANAINGQALERAQISFSKLRNMMQQSQGKIGMTYTAGGQTKSVSTLGTNLKA
jgi:flagella synthesis protein FlgN